MRVDKQFREKIRNQVLDRMDLSGEIRDEDVNEIIDICISNEVGECYIPLKEKIGIRSDIFNAIRRLDVLSDFLEDDSITEVMINGTNSIFYEQEGRIKKSDRCFEDSDRLTTVIQQIVGAADRMVNESNPIVDVILSDGSRVNVVLNGISVD